MAGRAILDTVDTSFGSDRNGLVWGYVFRHGRAPGPIDAVAAGELLAVPPDDQPWFLWLHFSLSNAATERWLRQHAGLPESFLAGLRDSGVSTRLEQDGSALIAVIHDVLFDFGFDAADVATAFLCVGPRLMVSARPRPLRSLDRLRVAVKGGLRDPTRAAPPRVRHHRCGRGGVHCDGGLVGAPQAVARVM